MNFSEKLKKIREINGWKMTYVSSFLNVPYMSYVRWESGKPPAEHFQTLIIEKLNKRGCHTDADFGKN